MIVLSGGDIVLPDRILTSTSLIVDGDRIAAIDSTQHTPPAASVIDARDSFVVPASARRLLASRPATYFPPADSVHRLHASALPGSVRRQFAAGLVAGSP